jgi:hypothetical protein
MLIRHSARVSELNIEAHEQRRHKLRHLDPAQVCRSVSYADALVWMKHTSADTHTRTSTKCEKETICQNSISG